MCVCVCVWIDRYAYTCELQGQDCRTQTAQDARRVDAGALPGALLVMFHLYVYIIYIYVYIYVCVCVSG